MNDAEIKHKLELVYDQLYERAEKLLKEGNPCQWNCGKCIGMKRGTVNNTPQCCCEGCCHWKTGCTADKPLTCKLWLCKVAKKSTDKNTRRGLLDVSAEANRLGFFAFRGEKKESIDAAMWFMRYPSTRKNVIERLEGLYKV